MSSATLRHISKSVQKISRDGKISTRRFDGLVQEMAALELLASQTNSLLYKLNPAGGKDETLSRLVTDLVAGREASANQVYCSKTNDFLLADVILNQMTSLELVLFFIRCR